MFGFIKDIIKNKIGFFTLLFLCFFSLNAKALIVDDIIIQGNQRIEPATVKSYMTIGKNDDATPKKVNQSLKNLFATGLFADVSFSFEKNVMIVKVVENPVINQIFFEGNRRMQDEMLESEIVLRPRSVFTRAKVQSEVKKIMEIYRRSGRFAVVVEPKVIQREQNRVDLVFEINEGSRTYIKKINFIGNEKIDDSELGETILSREEHWYRFFSSMDTFDPERLEYDKELLRRHYVKKGYADFRVVSAVAELSPDKKNFFITFTLDEGNRYKFGDISIESSIKEIKTKELYSDLNVFKDNWYNAEKIEDTIQNLTDTVSSLGYAFADVNPKVDKDKENKIVAINFNIDKGPKVFVEKINISGNVRTLDSVIRREFSLVEGDAFNSAKLRKSKKKLEDLDFFEKVDVKNVPSVNAEDKTQINVDVAEKTTGELNFSVGYSTNDGALVGTSIVERNLLGKGQYLKLAVSLAQKDTKYDISFTEPYFLDREIKAGYDLYMKEQDLQDESSYDLQSKGGALRMGWNWGEYLGQYVRYTLKEDVVSNVDEDASIYVKEEEGRTLLSSISTGLFFDKRDSKINPTQGYTWSLTSEFAGLGGNKHYIRPGIGFAYYHQFSDKWVGRASVNVSSIMGIGEDVRLNDRFYLGGDKLRGFKVGGVGALDKKTRDAIGSNWIAYSSFQLNFPLGLPKELGVKGRLFTDLGLAGEPDNYDADKVDYSSNLRASIGTGMQWMSPIGPINLDLALPYLKEEFDKTENFRLNFGTRF